MLACFPLRKLFQQKKLRQVLLRQTGFMLIKSREIFTLVVVVVVSVVLRQHYSPVSGHRRYFLLFVGKRPESRQQHVALLHARSLLLFFCFSLSPLLTLSPLDLEWGSSRVGLSQLVYKCAAYLNLLLLLFCCSSLSLRLEIEIGIFFIARSQLNRCPSRDRVAIAFQQTSRTKELSEQFSSLLIKLSFCI